MIALPTDSVRIGDTLRVAWDLPAGARVLAGPRADDSLAVRTDTARAGQWLLQPLALGSRGGDTLRALSPNGDTLAEILPPWRVVPAITAGDSSVASLLPPRDRPIPFPWRETALGLGALLLVGAAIWAWRRHRARRPAAAPPPAPVVPVHDRIRQELEDLERRSGSGMPARDVAFHAGVLLRRLHGEILDWPEAVDATSREWRARIAAPLPQVSDPVVAFLEEADPLRYADDARDASRLLERARAVLDSTPARVG